LLGFFFISLIDKKNAMCYEKLLGLQTTCRTYQPVNGVFLEQVTGITDEELGQLITDQYSEGHELFDDKVKQAWEMMSSEIINYLQPSLKGDTILQGARIGFPIGNEPKIQSALGAGNWVGIRLNSTANGSYLNTYISSINIWSQVDVNVTVHVMDMQTKKKIDTFTVDTNTDTFIGKIYQNYRRDFNLALVYESTIDTFQTNVKRGYCSSCGGGYSTAHCNRLNDAVAVSMTLDGLLNPSVVTNIGYTYGMSIDYNVTCDMKAWICSISNVLDYALAFYTSALIMDYATTISINSRVNTTVSVNVEECIARKQAYMIAYKEQLENNIRNMRVPNDAECFVCKQNVKYVQFSI
jgi:hypothetical protein